MNARAGLQAAVSAPRSPGDRSTSAEEDPARAPPLSNSPARTTVPLRWQGRVTLTATSGAYPHSRQARIQISRRRARLNWGQGSGTPAAPSKGPRAQSGRRGACAGRGHASDHRPRSPFIHPAQLSEKVPSRAGGAGKRGPLHPLAASGPVWRGASCEQRAGGGRDARADPFAKQDTVRSRGNLGAGRASEALARKVAVRAGATLGSDALPDWAVIVVHA